MLKVLQGVPGLAVEGGLAGTGIVARLNQEMDEPFILGDLLR